MSQQSVKQSHFQHASFSKRVGKCARLQGEPPRRTSNSLFRNFVPACDYRHHSVSFFFLEFLFSFLTHVLFPRGVPELLRLLFKVKVQLHFHVRANRSGPNLSRKKKKEKKTGGGGYAKRESAFQEIPLAFVGNL